jgi:hypothetical protein
MITRKLFEVEAFEKRVSNIVVTILNRDIENEIKISRPKFEAWLDRLGYLDIPMQYKDDEKLIDSFSKMTIDEYYENADVHEHLYNFLIYSKSDKFFKDALRDLEKITREYEN